MTDQPLPRTDLPLPQHLRVLQACDGFEEAWNHEPAPRIESFLAAMPAEDHAPLLKTLLALEVFLRSARGERPTPDEYYARFPESRTVVDEAFLEQTDSGALKPDPGSWSVPGDPADRHVLIGLVHEGHGAAPARAVTDVLVERLGSLIDGLGDHLRDRGAVGAEELARLRSVGASLLAPYAVTADADGRRANGDGTTHVGPAFPSLEGLGVGDRLERRYRIEGLHAMGGQGVVYKARDLELGRVVALKMLQERFAGDPGCRERFWGEAGIAAGLQHPGMVPLYSRGQDKFGRLFYAMPFIDRPTLSHAIKEHHAAKPADFDRAEHALAFRTLLRRFIDVCNAIAYAHERQVLHRDLKPQNIMLGDFGDTLVIDWGLNKVVKSPGLDPGDIDWGPEAVGPAKPDDASATTPDERTRHDQMLGTKGFLPPEQAGGEFAPATAASDIYSLGAILYCVMTGKAPYRELSVAEFAVQVKRGTFIPPRQLDKGIHPALEAACLKAMALRPEDRFGTAKGLADEIERWLADEPPQWYEEPWTDRAGRWLRRHKTGVIAAAVLLMVALPALSVITVLQYRARAQAVAGRIESDKNLKVGREAVLQLLIGLADEGLPYVPKMEPLRIKFNLNAADFYRKILAARPDDPEIRREGAMVFRRAGNILRMVGRCDESYPLYVQSLDLYASFPDELSGSNSLDRDAWAQAAIDYADALVRGSRRSEAIVRYREAIAEARAILKRRPDAFEMRSTLARALFSLADVLEEIGQDAEAKLLNDEALILYTDFVDRFAAKYPLARLMKTYPLRVRANLERNAGHPARAEAGYGEALLALKDFEDHIKAKGDTPTEPKTDPDGPSENMDVNYLTGFLLVDRARVIAADRGRRAEAERDLDRAVRLFDFNARNLPGIPRCHVELAMAYIARAETRERFEDVENARKDAEEALAVLERTRRFPSPIFDADTQFGMAYGLLGRIALRDRDATAARRWLQRALAKQSEALRHDPGKRDDERAKARHEEALRQAGQVAPPPK